MTDPTPTNETQTARQVLKTPPPAAAAKAVAQKDRQQFHTPAAVPTPDAQKDRQQLKTPPTPPAPAVSQGERQQFTGRPTPGRRAGQSLASYMAGLETPPTAPATPAPAVAFDESGGAVAEATGGPVDTVDQRSKAIWKPGQVATPDDVAADLAKARSENPDKAAQLDDAQRKADQLADAELAAIPDDDDDTQLADDGARADDHDGPLSDLTPGETPEPDGGYRPPRT